LDSRASHQGPFGTGKKRKHENYWNFGSNGGTTTIII
jgi:hypothetical protein